MEVAAGQIFAAAAADGHIFVAVAPDAGQIFAAGRMSAAVAALCSVAAVAPSKSDH